MLLDVEGERRRMDEIINKFFHFTGDQEYKNRK
jgi:hypothetical protein